MEGLILMEQVLERKAVQQEEHIPYHIYDEDGTEIRNPITLRSIAEGQRFFEMWAAEIKD